MSVVFLACTLLLPQPSPDGPQGPRPTAVLRDGDPNADRHEQLRFLRGEMWILGTKPVLAAALRRPDVAKLAVVRKQSDPEAWLKARLVLWLDEKTGSLRVSLADGTRREQAIVVNAVVEARLHHEATERRESKEKLIESTRSQNEAIRSLLAAREEVLRSMKSSTPDRQVQLLQEDLARSQERIARWEREATMPPRLHFLVKAKE